MPTLLHHFTLPGTYGMKLSVIATGAELFLDTNGNWQYTPEHLDRMAGDEREKDNYWYQSA